MATFKCIKPTIWFELGKIYETNEDGHVFSRQEWKEERYATSHTFSEREIRLNTEYFEEINDRTYSISASGIVYETGEHTACWEWNSFPSKEAAEMEVLRRESMAKRWRSTVWEQFWLFHFWDDQAYSSRFGCHVDYLDFFIWNTHKTQEDAEAWGKKYAEAFRYLLK